jgi:hypothetical protein
MADLSYELRERKRRALTDCPECDGEGTVTYTARNIHGEVEAPCPCLMRAGDFSEPDPLADEGQSDARELARERAS